MTEDKDDPDVDRIRLIKDGSFLKWEDMTLEERRAFVKWAEQGRRVEVGHLGLIFVVCALLWIVASLLYIRFC